MVTHRYDDGVAIAIYGDASLGELRSLMGAFSREIVVGRPSA